MKTTRALGVLFFGMLVHASLYSQVQFETIIRRANNVQTGPSTLAADPTTPVSFRANLEGNGLTSSSPISAATFTRPGGSPTALAFDSLNNGWTYYDDTQANMATLNSVYTTGAYAYNLTGTPNGPSSVTVSSFSGSLLTTPLMTVSGGSWVGNSYVINSASTLTVEFNAVYSGSPSGTQGYNFDVGLNANGYIQGPNGFANYDPTSSTALPGVTGPANFIVSAGTLAAGSYTIQVSYDDIQNFASTYNGTVSSASLLEYRTTLNLTVVPESSTYAAIFGAVALLGVVFRRPRRLRA